MNQQEYLDALIAEIDIAKKQNRNGIFRIREKLEDSVAIFVRDRLIAIYPQYRIDMRKCPACAFEWDIMVIF